VALGVAQLAERHLVDGRPVAVDDHPRDPAHAGKGSPRRRLGSGGAARRYALRVAAPAPSILLGLTGLRIEGGIASVSRCVARALDEAASAGQVARTDRVLLFEDPRAPAPPPRRGAQRLARGSQARFALEFWRERIQRRHDLVFFDLVGLARALRLPAPRPGRPRSAIFVHGLELPEARGGSRARALRGAWRVLTNSRTTAGRVEAAFPELAGRVRAVLLCVDPERAARWEREAPATPPPRVPSALIVGRMWSEERGKGHDQLLEAWPAVRKRVPGAELWIVGEGDDAARLAAKARAAGLDDAVRFLGRVGDRELGELYRRAGVLAMPSRQEGFGLVYAEALWHGLPCVGSTADAAGEVIAAGETGLLVPYGDVAAVGEAVASLLADPERCRRMGEAGARAARERFGYARFRDDLLRALELPPLA
jgi:phosphatidylinositol alpha-1,6-mannosyltransferase